MTGRIYLRAIVPIGVLYSASLVCSNQVYLYLSVAFIQMLKVIHIAHRHYPPSHPPETTPKPDH